MNRSCLRSSSFCFRSDSAAAAPQLQQQPPHLKNSSAIARIISSAPGTDLFKVTREQEELHLAQEQEQLYLAQEQEQLHLTQDQEQLHSAQDQEQLHLAQDQEQLHLAQDQEQLHLAQIQLYNIRQTRIAQQQKQHSRLK
jgi:hypothetical protein